MGPRQAHSLKLLDGANVWPRLRAVTGRYFLVIRCFLEGDWEGCVLRGVAFCHGRWFGETVCRGSETYNLLPVKHLR